MNLCPICVKSLSHWSDERLLTSWEAVEHLKKAVGQEPENAELRLLFARALEQAGDHEESRRQQARAEELRQKQPPQ